MRRAKIFVRWWWVQRVHLQPHTWQHGLPAWLSQWKLGQPCKPEPQPGSHQQRLCKHLQLSSAPGAEAAQLVQPGAVQPGHRPARCSDSGDSEGLAAGGQYDRALCWSPVLVPQKTQPCHQDEPVLKHRGREAERNRHCVWCGGLWGGACSFCWESQD